MKMIHLAWDHVPGVIVEIATLGSDHKELRASAEYTSIGRTTPNPHIKIPKSETAQDLYRKNTIEN